MFGEIHNQQGEELDYTFHPGQGDRLAIVGHGVTGNKDRPFVAALAKGLSAAGIGTLRFSFAGNGDSGGRFQDATISKEVDDLGAVLDAVGERSICYIGHSMGGAVGVLRASTDERIQVLISLAGMVHTEAFAQREFGEETPDAGLMWEDEDCPLSQAYMDDMAQIHSVADRAKHISVPWLLVHGTEDDVVPPQDTHDIMALAAGEAELLELPGADHVFSDDATAPMVEGVVRWLNKQLRGE
tara:strand:+ start:236 stop:961 length:726 start_codon:yes stop_codon:yes gene_type:complete